MTAFLTGELFDFNLTFNFQTVAGLVLIVLGAVVAFATDYVMKLLKIKNDEESNRKNVLKVASMVIVAAGALLVIYFK